MLPKRYILYGLSLCLLASSGFFFFRRIQFFWSEATCLVRSSYVNSDRTVRWFVNINKHQTFQTITQGPYQTMEIAHQIESQYQVNKIYDCWWHSMDMKVQWNHPHPHSIDVSLCALLLLCAIFLFCISSSIRRRRIPPPEIIDDGGGEGEESNPDDSPADSEIDEYICCACLSNKAKMECRPCGHQALCLSCYSRYLKPECPLCRGESEIVRIEVLID